MRIKLHSEIKYYILTLYLTTFLGLLKIQTREKERALLSQSCVHKFFLKIVTCYQIFSTISEICIPVIKKFFSFILCYHNLPLAEDFHLHKCHADLTIFIIFQIMILSSCASVFL